MHPSELDHERRISNRRGTPTSPWSCFGWSGQRTKMRRAGDMARPFYVDRFGVTTLIFALLLLAFTFVDGVITLHLLDRGCCEINPIMSYLLSIGARPFLLGKYILTAAGLPVLLVFHNHPLFGTRLRVGYLLPVFNALYVILLCYQWSLWSKL